MKEKHFHISYLSSITDNSMICMGVKMDYIKAIIYIGAKAGKYANDISKESLQIMKAETGCNTVIFNIGAFQETAHSENVDYMHECMQTDAELIEMIDFARKLDLKVILKPVVNCKDGTWRAYISFFEIDVVCEPKWSNWFKSYTQFQLHYAEIAEQTRCDMLIVGSDMVQAERKETEWRNLIKEVRNVYSGLLSYTADKYQEENVKWWDALDVISSCGYYPKEDFGKELDRIEQLAKKYQKPYFMGEIGCKSTAGSAVMPNRWALQGSLNLEEQAGYFEEVLKVCKRKDFVRGIGIWSWSYNLPEDKLAQADKGYRLYLKPACKVIHKQWNE